MRHDDLLSRVERMGGLRRRSAERAIRATLFSLNEHFGGPAVDALRRELPGELSSRPSRCSVRPADLDGFFATVGDTERVPRGFGKEHAEVVCRALGELVSDETAIRLQRELPPAAAELFARPPEAGEPSPYAQPVRHPEEVIRNTLAAGRPGARNPISSGRPERAHSQSVARSGDPHGDTKLSGAHGLTQERLEEDIAEGEPGPHRPIATTR